MRNYRLPLALALLAVLALLVLRSRTVDQEAANEAPDPATLLPTLQADAITEVAIDSPKKGSVTLTLQDGRWLVTRPVHGPADPELAQSLIDTLAGMKAAGVAATLAKHHARLWVDAANGIHVVVKGGQSTLLDFVLGRYMPANEESMVRLSSEEQVVRVPGWLREHVEHEVDEWRKHSFFDVEPDAVTRIRFQSERGELAFTRDGDSWKPVEGQPAIEPLDQKGLTDRAAGLARFRGSDFAPPDVDVATTQTGPDAPVIVRFDAKGDPPRSFELRIGAEAGTVKRKDGTDKQMHYVQHDDDPIMYRTSKYLHDWMSPDPAALVAKAPTEAPQHPATAKAPAAAGPTPAPTAPAAMPAVEGAE